MSPRSFHKDMVERPRFLACDSEILPELRPTPDRVRETLFNWLQYNLIINKSCLDLFAGSAFTGQPFA